MTGESAAVMLDAGEGCPAAIARHEFVEVLDAARTYHVPSAPPDCDRLVSWRGELIPVVDLAKLAGTVDQEDAPARNLALVVAYQPMRGEPLRYGCLRLEGYPRAIIVSDAQGCELSPEKAAWREISRCAFMWDGKDVPILDLPRIFSSGLGLRHHSA